MATIQNFGGVETGGLEDAESTTGSPNVQNTTVDVGQYALKLTAAATLAQVRYDIRLDGGGASNDIIVGARIRHTDVTPANEISLISIDDGNALNVHISLRLLTNGDIQFMNAAGTKIGSAVASGMSTDTWHTVEMRFARSDSGDAKAWIDGVEKLSVTGQDFLDLNLGAANRLVFPGYDDTAGNPDKFVDGWYAIDGVTADAERLGGVECFAYQKSDGGATELGDALDVGTWALLSETPGNETDPGNVGEYTVNAAKAGAMRTSTGSRSGPSGDANIDGDSNIKAMKGLYRAGRSGGSATTHTIRMGNSGDGSGSYLETNVTLTGAFATQAHLSEAATVVPLSTEWCEIGIKKSSGGRDFRGGDFWAMVLHVPDAPPAGPAGPPVGSLATMGIGR